MVRAGALLLAAAAALAALLSQGGRFSDRLDILTHAAPIWLAAGLAVLVVWLCVRRQGDWITPLLAVAAILSAGQLVVPALLKGLGKPAPVEGEVVKIVQFNLWVENNDPTATANWILAQDPDIVVTEEALGGAADVLRQISGRYPYKVTCDGQRKCSTIILSKKKPIASDGMMDDVYFPVTSATFQGAGGPFTVIGVHSTWPLPAGPQQQQTKRLANALAGLPKERMIIAGDFNSTPWSFSLKRQDKAFGIERRTHGVFSWPANDFAGIGLKAPFPVLAIDQVYAGDGWRTVSIKRGPTLGSDHYPLLVTLAASR